jgi:hypothetical protein
MPAWLRRTRAAITTGLLWALVWAPTGILAGLLIDPDNSMDEMWVAVFGLPGFLGGVLFSAILAIAERRRTVGELTLPRVASWGGLAGCAVCTVPFLLGEPISSVPVWWLYGVVAGSTTAVSAISAAATVAIARRFKVAELPPADVVAMQRRG